MKMQQGFSLVEALVVLAFSLVAILYFFRIVTLFLQTRAEQMVNQDVLAVSDNILIRFKNIAQNANNLSTNADGSELRVTGNPCALLKYDSTTKTVGYSEDSTTDCIPPTTITAILNAPPVEVSSLTFAPLATSSAKSVRLSFTLFSERPFATKSSSFATAVTVWRK